ncbi:galactokinase [Paraliobacillus ryukyuensis]|uniref:Galactokinase n=1 Tax=Paraliobacillus ryukyuensis TaxID=200904 RepID=A0A366EDH4_9BACI|nr:galactokinase [Paraliobacillus ryukyuensis]RBP00437.1 galactokinase [Paraliobacillus ryukyuensis]
MEYAYLKNAFQTIFSRYESPRIFFAPGRINLIGEHTDYNGGYVFPASISFGTYAVALKRNDRKIRLYSLNFKESGIIEVDLDALTYNKAHQWANYPKGMVKEILAITPNIITGFDVLYYGNIPNGAGLSSSASIEMVTGVLLDKLYELSLDRIQLIKISQYVENTYIGVNSGIMDQFAIGMGKRNHAILLDCNTLEYTYAPLSLNHYDIVIMNTNKRRELADSKYNERRSECERARSDLQIALNIKHLGDLSIDRFEANKHLIKNEKDQKRAKHAVYENARTKQALEALQANDLHLFGQLINQSHLSLQHDYEVTGIELDTIVSAAWEEPGVLGARMTGAGFGGCAIALVPSDQVEAFKTNVNTTYTEKIGYDASFYVAAIGDGAKELKTEGVL